MAELLVKEIHNIFMSMRPVFVRQAYKYRMSNIDDFVDGWMSKAFLVAHKIDAERALESKEFLTIECLHNFRGYLYTSFVNDIVKNYHSNKKLSGISLDDVHVADLTKMEETESYHVSDFRSALAFELEEDKAKVLSMTRSQYVSYCVRYAMYEGFCMLEKRLDNPPIAPVDAKSFSLTLSDHMNDMIHEVSANTSFVLTRIGLDEFCPSTQGEILDIINESGILKRINEYIKKMHTEIEVGMNAHSSFQKHDVLRIVPSQKLKLAKKYEPSAANGSQLTSDADVKLRTIFAPVILVNEQLLQKKQNDLKDRVKF